MKQSLFNRRSSLVTLSVAGLASAIANPRSSSAGKKRKTRHEKSLSPTALCRKQVDQCFAFFTPGCKDDASCLATMQRCCPSLGICGLDGFFECVSESAVAAQLAPISTP